MLEVNIPRRECVEIIGGSATFYIHEEAGSWKGTIKLMSDIASNLWLVLNVKIIVVSMHLLQGKSLA